MTELTIVKVFEFSSQTLRSGVVVLANDGPRNTARLFIRGAPAVIQDLVEPSSLPPDFDQVRRKPSCVVKVCMRAVSVTVWVQGCNS